MDVGTILCWSYLSVTDGDVEYKSIPGDLRMQPSRNICNMSQLQSELDHLLQTFFSSKRQSFLMFWLRWHESSKFMEVNHFKGEGKKEVWLDSVV